MSDLWARFMHQRRHDVTSFTAAYIILALALVFGLWATWRNRQELKAQIRVEHAAEGKRDLEMRLAWFRLCRSDGRDVQECRRVANGVVLPALTDPQAERIKGILGKPGPLGPQGISDLLGKTGLQGLRGPQGSPGKNGAAGPRGFPGTQGIPGMPGHIGPAGARGAQGARGQPGAPGPAGPPGPPGTTGCPLGLTLRHFVFHQGQVNADFWACAT